MAGLRQWLRLWKRGGRAERLAAARGIAFFYCPHQWPGVDAVAQNRKPVQAEGVLHSVSGGGGDGASGGGGGEKGMLGEKL